MDETPACEQQQQQKQQQRQKVDFWINLDAQNDKNP